MAAWYIDLVRPLTPFDPTPSIDRLDRLEAEHIHLRATLGWLERSGRMSELAELATRLRWFWHFGGREVEGLRWYERVMESMRGILQDRWLDSLLFAGQFAVATGDENAAGHLSAALSMARATGDPLREAEATFYLGVLAENTGNYAEAETHLRHASTLHEALRHAWRQ